MQAELLALLPGKIVNIDHDNFLPFSLIPEIPLHPKPTLASTSWGTFHRASLAAKSLGANILLTGHGGDTLFRWHPSRQINFQLPTDLGRDFISTKSPWFLTNPCLVTPLSSVSLERHLRWQQLEIKPRCHIYKFVRRVFAFAVLGEHQNPKRSTAER